MPEIRIAAGRDVNSRSSSRPNKRASVRFRLLSIGLLSHRGVLAGAPIRVLVYPYVLRVVFLDPDGVDHAPRDEDDPCVTVPAIGPVASRPLDLEALPRRLGEGVPLAAPLNGGHMHIGACVLTAVLVAPQ